MAWRAWTREDPPDTGTEGQWDPPGKIFAQGIMLPLALLVWIALEGMAGVAWLPGRRGGMDLPMAQMPLAFAGALLAKFGAAALAFTTWVIGNHRRLGWHTEKFALACYVLIAVGILMLVGGIVGSMAD